MPQSQEERSLHVLQLRLIDEGRKHVRVQHLSRLIDLSVILVGYHWPTLHSGIAYLPFQATLHIRLDIQ